MYLIKGTYKGRRETLDHAESQHEAEYMLNQYRLAFRVLGQGWLLELVQVDGDEEVDHV